MKYVLMCLGALVLCVICGFIPAKIISKKKGLKRVKTLLLTLLFCIILICLVMFGYLGVYYHADPIDDCISDSVQMTEIDGGYFFDGPGTDAALIFYPGAKVETIAYAPLMSSLAENGIDCFLADMPFRMAFFGANTADKFMNSYSYDTWIAAGHSMGGLVISGYASDHADQIDGLVLLASYPGSDIPDSITLRSIYGSNDGCLNREAYDDARVYWPTDSTEYILEGGNHAQYANYGPQSGDLDPGISREDQQGETVEIILGMIGQ